MAMAEFPIVEFTKEQYMESVKIRRREFVFREFGPVLRTMFKQLEKDAEEMKNCHHEITFDVPYHFDIDKVEIVVCQYLRDLGYSPLPEPRKGSEEKITITVT